jgi:hypothetical protein
MTPNITQADILAFAVLELRMRLSPTQQPQTD